MNEERSKKQFDPEKTFNALKITKRIPLSNKTESIEAGHSGCNELIAIFVKSIDAASKGGSGAK